MNKISYYILTLLFLVSVFFSGFAANNVYVFDLTDNVYNDVNSTSFYVKDNTYNDLDVSSTWTFECWLYVDDRTSGTYPVIMDRYHVFSFYLIDGATGGDYAVRFVRRDNSSNIIASVRSDDLGSNPIVTHFDTWYHVAVSRDGSTTRLFINGTLADESNDPDFELPGSTAALNIGARYWGGYQRFLDGALDEVRVSNIARYTSNFAISTSSPPFSDDGNTLLLFHFDDNSAGDVVPNNAATNYTFEVRGHNCAWPDNYTPWNGLNDDLSLPVEITSFAIIPGDNQAVLKWSTQSEVSNLGFEVYRSTNDQEQFQLIASYENTPSLRGSGNSNASRDYTFTDHNVLNGQTYWYKLAAVAMNGERHFFGPLSVIPNSNGANLTQNDVIPKTYALHQNFPNPFNPTTTIRFDIPENTRGATQVTLTVYDVMGHKVRTLVNDMLRPASYSVTWDGLNDNGQPVSSGIYIYHLRTEKFSSSHKMMLVR